MKISDCEILPKVIKAKISPPIYVDSRKSAREIDQLKVFFQNHSNYDIIIKKKYFKNKGKKYRLLYRSIFASFFGKKFHNKEWEE